MRLVVTLSEAGSSLGYNDIEVSFRFDTGESKQGREMRFVFGGVVVYALILTARLLSERRGNELVSEWCLIDQSTSRIPRISRISRILGGPHTYLQNMSSVWWDITEVWL